MAKNKLPTNPWWDYDLTLDDELLSAWRDREQVYPHGPYPPARACERMLDGLWQHYYTTRAPDTPPPLQGELAAMWNDPEGKIHSLRVAVDLSEQRVTVSQLTPDLGSEIAAMTAARASEEEIQEVIRRHRQSRVLN